MNEELINEIIDSNLNHEDIESIIIRNECKNTNEVLKEIAKERYCNKIK